MNINDVISVDNKFLKAVDLKGRKTTLRIESYTVEDFKDMRGGSKRQIVLKFRGAEKVLGLNKINTKMIASMYGDETDNWIGREIILFPSKTQDATGAIVDCVRIEYRLPATEPQSAAVNFEPDSDALRTHDEALAAAAARGVTALKVAWTLVPRELQPSLKAALDRRHKPAAEKADLAGAMNDEVPF